MLINNEKLIVNDNDGEISENEISGIMKIRRRWQTLRIGSVAP